MSLLPEPVRRALLERSDRVSRSALQARSQGITAAYRGDMNSSGGIRTEADALAYALARMPATYAAARAALRAARDACPEFRPEAAADLGAGTGAASLAALDVFPTIGEVALVDSNPSLLAMAPVLLTAVAPDLSTACVAADLRQAELPSAPVLLSAYVLVEMVPPVRAALISRILTTKARMVVLVEPGTPSGAECLQQARTAAIENGWTLAAPCGHAAPCPRSSGGSWCHFDVRVQRSKDHRLLKSADKPFEDEPFAYLVLTRDLAFAPSGLRILDRPKETKASRQFSLCTREGVRNLDVPRRDKDAFRETRRLERGDLLPLVAGTRATD